VVPSLAVATAYDFRQTTDSSAAPLPTGLSWAVILRLGFHLTDQIWLRYSTTIPFGSVAVPSLTALLQAGF
jgi:hypothetical protein